METNTQQQDDFCIYCSGGVTSNDWPKGATGVLFRAVALNSHAPGCDYAESLDKEIEAVLSADFENIDALIDATIALAERSANA